MGKRKATWGGRRDGAGRPAEIKQPARLEVRLPQELLERAKDTAALTGISLSAFVRKAIERSVK